MRRSRHYTQKTPDHGRITETVSIRERPAEAKDRAVPGHCEGDLFFGSSNSQIATLVERRTRYLLHVRVADKDSDAVINALIKQAHKLPQELYKSLTWDRGSEMADTYASRWCVFRRCRPGIPLDRSHLFRRMPAGRVRVM
jgi:IS30 family transposase